jgi:hypothetical protein
MRKKQNLLAALLGLLLLGSLVVAFAAAPDYVISWWVIAGGGQQAGSANYYLDGTIGQTAIGLTSSGNYRIGSGYWYGALESAAPAPTPTIVPGLLPRLKIPVIMRNYWSP